MAHVTQARPHLSPECGLMRINPFCTCRASGFMGIDSIHFRRSIDPNLAMLTRDVHSALLAACTLDRIMATEWATEETFY